MFKKSFLLFLFICAAACSPAGPTLIPTPATDQIIGEEQDVYAFLLAKLYQHKSYVIMADTATNSTGVDNTAQTLDYVLQNMHGMASGTLDSFRARNTTAQVLRPDMQLGGPYTLLSQTAKNQIFSQNQSGWDIFYNRYPQAPGITTFSRVGFNASLDQALVYMGTQSNWLVGTGNYFLLKKVNGTWSIDQQVLIWVS
ncbi:MAG: hypothetical protein ABSA23_07300 [Anaerolineales bacterium]|jgi:hypothetical protein